MRLIAFIALVMSLSLHPVLAADHPALRIGVVGLTHSHVHGLLGRDKLGDVEIVGIAEKNKDLARRYTREHGLSMDIVFDSMEEMVAKTKPAAVAAFGSINEHLGVVEMAAPLHIHVMVEKPLAIDMNQARRMKELADRNHIVLMVNYETTWYPTLYAAADLVDSGQIGPLRKIVVHDGHKGPKKIGVNQEFLDWLADPAQNGAGALTDFGCYGANLTTYLMHGRRPISVTAVTQQFQPQDYPKVEDEATIILTYPETQAVIQASWNWPIARKDMEIYGVQGYVMTDNRHDLRVRVSDTEKERAESLPERSYPGNDPFATFKSLIDGTAKLGPWDPSSLENNMLVTEILDAARQSASQGKTIRF